MELPFSFKETLMQPVLENYVNCIISFPPGLDVIKKNIGIFIDLMI